MTDDTEKRQEQIHPEGTAGHEEIPVGAGSSLEQLKRVKNME